MSYEPIDCVNMNLRRVVRKVGGYYDRLMKDAAISPTQFSLLMQLQLLTPASVSQIAHAISMDRTTLTRNLRLLERDGLVEQSVGDDARMRFYAITERGRHQLGEARPQWEAAHGNVIQRFGENRWRALRSELKALQDCLAVT